MRRRAAARDSTCPLFSSPCPLLIFSSPSPPEGGHRRSIKVPFMFPGAVAIAGDYIYAASRGDDKARPHTESNRQGRMNGGQVGGHG